MRSIITQVCNGVLHGQTYTSDSNSLDKGNSNIFASSLFVHLNELGENIEKPKNTDDKIVIGYTNDGMAFQIVVDGFYGGERDATFSFIDNHIIPLMQGYSSDLTAHSDSQKITESLIHDIYSLRSKYAPLAEFTMSVSMTYEKDDKLFCAGFGIGDTGIVIKRTNGAIEQLVCHTEVDGFKDAFDGYSSSNIDLILKRNSLFNTQVMPGDELVGYTYTLPRLEITTNQFNTETTYKDTVKVQQVNSLSLNPEYFDLKSSLFSQLLNVTRSQQTQLFAAAQKSGQIQRFGDDFTVGQLIIPDRGLRNQLKTHALVVAVNESLNSYINDEKRGLWGMLGFFTGSDRNIHQATLYKNLLIKYQDNSFIAQIILLGMISHGSLESMKRYLASDLNCSSIISLNNKVKELILHEIEAPEVKLALGHRLATDVVDELRTKIVRYVNDPSHLSIDDTLETFQEQFKLASLGH